jgi:hypothetical protein
MERASTGWDRSIRGVSLAGALLYCGAAGPAAAQRLLDLDPRTSAGAEAVVGGAAAVFWNPAGIGALARRGEASVVDVNGPESTGLGGLAFAAALRLDDRTTVAFGIQHAAIEGIELTSESPLPGLGEGIVDVSEDVLSAAGARTFSDVLTVGLAVHYVRAADLARVDDAFELGGGFAYRPELPLAPVAALSVRREEDETAWLAGLEITPLRPATDWAVTASYGATAGGRERGVGHRVATGARYRDRASVSIGAAGAGDDGAFAWAPVAAAELRLARYIVGVLRESLASDFGAVYALRFTVQF